MFHGNSPEAKHKDNVPRFPAAQDEDGETFKANQSFRQSSLVVFASPTFAKHAAIHQCGCQALPFKSSPPHILC
jgi:hypothetical protein